MEYEIEEAKTYSVKVEATDDSNYFVEETSNFVVGTDIFEVKLLPEYGDLIGGKKNDVYVFTSNADGSPVKSYVTISSNNYTKQIMTDENGIGKFSIDIEATNTNKYSRLENNTKSLKINAVNMNGEKVQKSVSLSVKTKNVLASTNKIKYEQGEEIKINVSSQAEKTKNIYFFKNDKLIKLLKTDSEETDVNLGDTYGIIDVYVTQDNTYDSCKRTIFIKPKKELNINIETDKKEYKPGDNITISFGTSDEDNNSVDSALLVSMLDNSILNLANNDLSIDNIKLALSDISFSDELDATTLYSCIVDDKSEQTMMALLLKQNDSDSNILETVVDNYQEKVKAAVISVLTTIIVILTLIFYLCKKFPKFKEFMKHVVNFVIFTLIIVLLSMVIIDEYVDSIIDYSWGFFGIIVIACLAIYIALISKIKNKIFRTSISNIILGIIFMIAVILIEEVEVDRKSVGRERV